MYFISSEKSTIANVTVSNTIINVLWLTRYLSKTMLVKVTTPQAIIDTREIFFQSKRFFITVL